VGTPRVGSYAIVSDEDWLATADWASSAMSAAMKVSIRHSRAQMDSGREAAG
jgi:hypothetical protein